MLSHVAGDEPLTCAVTDRTEIALCIHRVPDANIAITDADRIILDTSGEPLSNVRLDILARRGCEGGDKGWICHGEFLSAGGWKAVPGRTFSRI
jgi:hypothetical protein